MQSQSLKGSFPILFDDKEDYNANCDEEDCENIVALFYTNLVCDQAFKSVPSSPFHFPKQYSSH